MSNVKPTQLIDQTGIQPSLNTGATGFSTIPAGIPANRAPTSSDLAPQFTLWDYVAGRTVWMQVAKGMGSSWTALGTGASGGVVTITGDSGGAEAPLAGNFSLLGTANQITVTGGTNKETFSVPSTFIAPGSIAATTTVTATLGAITATNGNFVLGTAGNKIISSSVASTTTAGANSFGTVTLVGGTATVSTSAVTASSIIILSRQSVGSSTALGQLTTGTIVASTSFVINAATQATPGTPLAADVSVIGWMIIN